METENFGITQKSLNDFKKVYDIVKQDRINAIFTEIYKEKLLKKYFRYIKNIINNK